MDFLDRFSERDRDRLVAAATTVRLARGELLLRRGERGGDIFRVAEGELEVIDTRSQPAIVLDVMGKGAVVGEMAFIAERVRSADVRAPDGAICQRWERATLLRLLEQEPAFAAGFYRVLAGMLVERQRSITSSAVAGAIGGHVIPRGPTNEVAVSDGRALAEALQSRLMELEPAIRRDRVTAEREILAALHNFGAALGEALARMTEEDGRAAGKVIGRELHPYVMRSHLGEAALAREAASAAGPAIAYILANRPDGDGPLGTILDGWLLGLPTCRALRERGAIALQCVLDALPTDAPLRMLAINPGGGLVAQITSQLAGRIRGEITCVDNSREDLALLERAVPRARDLRLRLVQDDLAGLCLGRSKIQHPPQQVVVLDGLFEYLPERVAASLLRWARGVVAPGGSVVTTGLLPSADEVIFHHVLAWPTVRRTKAATTRLLAGAGFADVRVYEAGPAGLVTVSR